MKKQLFSTTFKVNGVKKQFNVIAVDTETKKADDAQPEAMHHIHVIDRSGSMSGSLEDLVEDVKKTISTIGDKDNLSIVWFSENSKILIKGANKNTPNLERTLDDMKRTISTTCFSKAFENVEECIKDLPHFPVANVTLFTDGCPVVNWSVAEEERRILEIVDRIKDKAIMINCVGYGNYYNKELLTKISEKSAWGKMIHIDDVESYHSIWKRNYLKVAGVTPANLKVETTGNIFVFNNATSSTFDKKAEFEFLNDGVTYIVIPSENDEVKVNGVVEKFPKLSKGDTAGLDIDTLLYVMMFESYYKGLDIAIDYAVTLGDKFFIDGILNSFTAKERQNLLNTMESAIKDKASRMTTGKAPAKYIPAVDAFCLMDLINILSSGPNMYVPDMAGYKRIGKEKKATNNKFVASTKPVTGKFEDLVLNESLLNIGVRFKIPGSVNVDDVDRPLLNNESTIDCYIYNTHSIIKDGALNIENLHVIVDQESYDLIKLNVNKKHIAENKIGGGMHELIIDLSKIPVINRKYAKDNDLEALAQTVKDVNVLKAKQKAIKTLIQEDQKYSGDKYTIEQYKLLKEKYDIDKTMAYAPKVYEVIPTGDYYDARSIDFDIAGWSSLPKVEDVIAKKAKGKDLKESETIMVEAVTNTSDPVKQLKTVKEEIRSKSFKLSILKLGKILTGTFWPGLIIDGDKYKFISSAGDELKVKLEYKRIHLL